MEPIITCPLGSKCEEIKDNQMHRCAWYTKLEGKNPQNLQDVNEYACAIAWLPLLSIQNTRASYSTTESVVSLRESTLQKQDMALGIISRGLIDAAN